VAGTLTFQPGETAKTIQVAVAGDLLNEARETFFLNLSEAVNAGLPDNQAVAAIIDNDAKPRLTIDDVQVQENAGVAVFTIRLAAVSGQVVQVNFMTSNRTARTPGDYTAVTNTITFQPGETTKTVEVPIIDDATAEGIETFFAKLSNPRNAILGDALGIGTIPDDD
jgi:hypothetical protein